jgi:hypothetical protein
MWKIAVILGLNVFFCSSVFGDSESCSRESQRIKESDSLVGYGSGNDYESAKSAALADAISFMGVKINASGTVLDAGQKLGPESVQTISTESEMIVKGAKILTVCKDDNTKVVVAIPKALIATLIEQKCLQRLDWIKRTNASLAKNTSPKALKAIRQRHRDILQQENDDLESWIVLGRSPDSFKKIHGKDLHDLSDALASHSDSPMKTLRIFVAGPLARDTLSALQSYLKGEGIKAVKASVRAPDTAIWTCAMTKGTPMGQMSLFVARCDLTQSDVDIPGIKITGIAPEESMNETAVRLLSDELETKKAAEPEE